MTARRVAGFRHAGPERRGVFPDHVARVLGEVARVVRVERIRRGFERQSGEAATDVVAGVRRERIRRREYLKRVAALDGLIVEPEIAFDEAVSRARRLFP